MKYFGALLFACSAVACGGQSDPAVEICDALSAAGTAITAAETREAAPALTVGDTAFEVSLPVQKTSWLKITAAGDTPVLFAASAKEVVNGLYFGDQQKTLGEGAPLAECADRAPEHFDLDLDTAGDWFIELAPAAISSVRVVAGAGEDHADE